jgi:hypothetical protein
MCGFNLGNKYRKIYYACIINTGLSGEKKQFIVFSVVKTQKFSDVIFFIKAKKNGNGLLFANWGV